MPGIVTYKRVASLSLLSLALSFLSVCIVADRRRSSFITASVIPTLQFCLLVLNCLLCISSLVTCIQLRCDLTQVSRTVSAVFANILMALVFKQAGLFKPPVSPHWFLGDALSYWCGNKSAIGCSSLLILNAANINCVAPDIDEYSDSSDDDYDFSYTAV
jgi:hypothetical protein